MLPLALNFRTMISPLPSRAVYTQRKVPKRGGPKHTTGGPDAHQSSDHSVALARTTGGPTEADIHPFPKQRSGPKHTTGGPDAHQSSDHSVALARTTGGPTEADIHPFPKQRGGPRLSLGFHINLVVIDFGVRDVCRCWAITELRISGIFRLR
jgi:hypothetical protein